MDIAEWLGIKSREQEEREFQAFSESSFPYGQAQRDKMLSDAQEEAHGQPL